MDRQNLLRRVGNMQQLAYVRPMTYGEGRSSGMKAYEVKNGDLLFRVLADKCLDVAELSYKDISRLFGKSESWARVTYYRAKCMIVERLEGGGKDEV